MPSPMPAYAMLMRAAYLPYADTEPCCVSTRSGLGIADNMAWTLGGSIPLYHHLSYAMLGPDVDDCRCIIPRRCPGLTWNAVRSGHTWMTAESAQSFITGMSMEEGGADTLSNWELYTTSLNWVATHTVSAIGNTCGPSYARATHAPILTARTLLPVRCTRRTTSKSFSPYCSSPSA